VAPPRPDPAGEITAHPRLPSWISGSLLLRTGKGEGRRGGKGTGGKGKRGGEGKVKLEGRGEKGGEWRRKGKGCPSIKDDLDPPLANITIR